MINRTRGMTQAATYWAPLGNDQFGGVEHAAPVELKVRWQDKAELARDAEGQEFTSSAVVYVPEPLEIKGQLLLGVSIAAEPAPGAREVRQKGQSPNLRGTEVLNKVWL